MFTSEPTRKCCVPVHVVSLDGNSRHLVYTSNEANARTVHARVAIVLLQHKITFQSNPHSHAVVVIGTSARLAAQCLLDGPAMVESFFSGRDYAIAA